MSFLKHLFGFFKAKPKVHPKTTDEINGCAFCWGFQEYNSQSRVVRQDKQIDVKNHRDKHVKVGKFMVEHVDGFKNKKRIIKRCPKCGGKRIKYNEKS